MPPDAERGAMNPIVESTGLITPLSFFGELPTLSTRCGVSTGLSPPGSRYHTQQIRHPKQQPDVTNNLHRRAYVFSHAKGSDLCLREAKGLRFPVLILGIHMYRT